MTVDKVGLSAPLNNHTRGVMASQSIMYHRTASYTIPRCHRRITSLFAPSKQRWTVAKLRDELALELGLDTPEQKANFRIRKQIMNGTEVKLSTTRTLKEEALFNDVKLFLVEGVAPAVGVLPCCPRPVALAATATAVPDTTIVAVLVLSLTLVLIYL